jgi:uncharacterized protein (TIRG00374 family)
VAHEPTEGQGPTSSERDSRDRRRPFLRSLVSLIVGGVALYLFLPRALSSASSWRAIRDADWPYAFLALLLQIVSWVFLWQLDRIALRFRDWFTVATAQMAGNALGRIVPGSATPFSVSLLHDAGMDAGQAAAGLATSTLLQIGTALSLPVLSVPALLAGAPINHSLLTAMYIGFAVLVVLVVVGAIALRTDGLLSGVGRAIQAVLNATVRRHDRLTGLAGKLLSDRDFILATIETRWRSALVSAATSTLFDFVSLLLALRAVHADPRPSLVVLAYVAAEVLTQVPFTPGGLGFVEAGLVGTLTLAGVPGSVAVAATLLYRLFSYWLPIPVGGLAYLLFRRRYHAGTDPAPDSPD